ncbi:MAG: hypothetical protein BWK75_02630 [Candidatus Altiarchaeales archaeon A3]|nr:MAG: hypothetical protein BWK75_02630 [Candidatus Altiarchaeales archaeon A3]
MLEKIKQDSITQQLYLPGKPADIHHLITTRYQGSKSKIASWIWDNIKDLKFNSALDAFGGTGVMGYLLKTKGKQILYPFKISEYFKNFKLRYEQQRV